MSKPNFDYVDPYLTFPHFLRPNLITLVGFCFSSLPFFVLFGAYGTSMYSEEGNEIPRWFYVLEAFCYLMYRLLDEMDGKQARRTGNSSPLGLLFDHGCDAFTMGLQAMVMVKCLQVGDNMKSVACVLAPCASFHFSTLEEYYTGGLFLGPFNGVTDGSLAVILCFLFMSVFGDNYWRWPIANAGTPNEIKLVDLMVFLNVTIQTVIIIMCLKAIFDHQKKSLGPNDITGETLNNKDLIVQVLGYFIPLVSLTLLAMMGEEPIIDYPAGRGQPNPLFYLILLQSLVMAHLTIQIQVNHCTKTLYSPFKSRLMLVELATVFFVYLLHLMIPKSFTKQAFTDTIIVLFVVHVVFQAHYVLKVVKEMATALGIRVLCVKPKYPDADDDGPKLSTTTGLEKDDESRSPADLASKLGARRLEADT